MTGTPDARKLLDDCFLHDKERMRHDEVLAMLRERLSCVVDTETVALRHAHRRIAAADMAAPRPVPLHENAAVDGYAFAHASYVARNGELTVSARLAAGDTTRHEIAEGECARIFTGAAMPRGADTVAMQEDCTVSGDRIVVPKGLKAGANRRHAGEDLAAGASVIEAGQSLRAQDIAALASMGVDEVVVRRRLRVAILATGDELVAPGGDIRHGQVFDSNSAMLTALAEAAGAAVTGYGILRDKAGRIEATLAKAAANSDLVITTGGASRGEEDHMLNALDRLGKRHLWQIAVKPGRPMMFGQVGDCVVTGLPGNPVAAFVCFLLYVRLAMALLAGARWREPARFPLPAGFTLGRKKPDRREFLRGFLDTDAGTGRPLVRKYPRDGSGLISGLRAADGLIELDEERTSVEEGDLVDFIPFSEFGVV